MAGPIREMEDLMKLCFFLGKGGVGKSTCASITALHYAVSGKKVSLISLDPAHNIMDIFSGFKESSPHAENLQIEEPDIVTWNKKFLTNIKYEMKKEYRHLNALNIDHLIDVIGMSPDAESYGMLKAFIDILESHSDKDIIIFDMPPTGMALRLLTMPHYAVRWIHELQTVRKKILSRRHHLHNVLGDVQYQKDYGADGAFQKEDDRIYEKLDALLLVNRGLADLIGSRDSCIIPVINEDKLSFKETERIISHLDSYELIPSFILCNKYSGNEEVLIKIKKHFKRDVAFINKKEDDYYADYCNLLNTETDLFGIL